ncbi:hypothetical protein PCK2_000781 [Pneumocystis canis]|nr:hypothetical protein PCK2_000781 [Pneumocystis canis]
MDDLRVERIRMYFESESLYVHSYWVEQMLSQMNVIFSDDEQWKQQIMQCLLNSDIKEILTLKSCLPKNVLDQHHCILPGPYCLQVIQIQDIGRSVLEQLEYLDQFEDDGRVKLLNIVKEEQKIEDEEEIENDKIMMKKMFKLLLEDASGLCIWAIEYKPIQEIHLKMDLGINKIYNPALIKYQARDFHEIQLSQSNYAYDQFIKYLEWELHQKPQEIELISTLYERLLKCYPLAVNIWEDYIQFMSEKSTFTKMNESFMQRAVKNYPWSGMLWAYYIYILETNNSSLEEICALKDRSISSGTLFHDINEFVKVLEAWCGYCKRRVKTWVNNNEETRYVITELQNSIKLLKNGLN